MMAVYELKKPICTTGTSIQSLIESTDAWILKQIAGLSYGDVAITFCVNGGHITHIRKVLTETDQCKEKQ